MQEKQWIFKDTEKPIPNTNKTLLDYLEANQIVPEGHLRADLEESEELALRYPAYAVSNCPHTKKLLNKIRLLAQNRGSSENDIERNYQNQLVEFHALFALSELMGFEFLDWDAKSPHARNSDKDCDLLFKLRGDDYFIEAKDCSSEITTQQDAEAIRKDVHFPKSINSHSDVQTRIRVRTNQFLAKQDDLTGITHFTPKMELTSWVNKQLTHTKNKGADILVCHPTGWNFTTLDPDGLKRYCDKAFPGAVDWSTSEPTWPHSSVKGKLIVFVNKWGCWSIKT